MIKATLQTHQSTIINLGHNNRTIKVPHADKEYGNQHNWYWSGNMTEKAFYDMTFEDDWKKRQAREKRKDRRTDKTYHEYLIDKREKAKKVKEEMRTTGATNYSIKQATKGVKPTSHELVVGIGNIRDNQEFGRDGVKMEDSKEILRRYIESFNERNKGCVVLYNASIHCDEKGVVHGHCDYCFVSKNKHGEREVSQTAALRELGFVSDKEKNEHGKRQNAITKWRDNEREVLKELCREYDIEIIDGTKGKKHLEKEEYIIEQERIKNELQHNENIDTAVKVIKQQQSLEDYIRHSENAKGFNEYYENKHYRKRDNRIRAEINLAWKEYQRQSEGYWGAYQRNKEIIINYSKEINKDLYKANYELNRAINNMYRINGGIFTFLFKVVILLSAYFNKKELEKKANDLRLANENINKQRKVISALQNDTKAALKSEDIESIKNAMKVWEKALGEVVWGIEQTLKEELSIIDTEQLENDDLMYSKNADDVLDER